MTGKFNTNNIKKYVKGKKEIFDIGSGPIGSYWWKYVDKNSKITGVDTMFFPKKIPTNVSIFKYDAVDLKNIKQNQKILQHKRGIANLFNKRKVNWINNFDAVVANHVLEHVSDPESVIKGINKLLKNNGIVYTGFPESSNFTDIFYHLIHSEGGGHIQLLSKGDVIKLFEKNGFELVECNAWPDDWLWFKNLYDFKSRGLVYIEKKHIDYIYKVFKKELTPEKGYFYGWETIFKKVRDIK